MTLGTPLPMHGRLPNWLVVIAALGLLGAAFGYLLLKTYQFADYPGFDFRYIWLAGELWSQNINPYGEAYEAEGAARIAAGHVPIKWVYPPSWWILATPLGLLGLHSASVVWNLFGLGLIAASAALLTASLLKAFPERLHWLYNWTGAATGSLIFASICFAIAVLEATGIHFAVGQTSLLIGFGLTLMLFGRVTSRQYLEIIGLIVVLLKPQIGVPYAALLFLLDPRTRQVVVLASIGTIALAIPAMIQSGGVLIDFVVNVLAYDDFTDANLPQSTTGIRLLIWEAGQIDIGNMMATLAALVLIVALSWGPLRLTHATDPNQQAWQVMGLSTAIIVAVAPLHIYDYVLIALPALLVLQARWQDWVLPGLGMLLIWRNETLAQMTSFHDPDVEIFPGSRLGTISAIIFLVGIVRIVQKMNETEAGMGASV